MPARPWVQTKIRTKLAERRIGRHRTQDQMVELTGISRASYVWLEQGRHPNPPLRWLTNCALVLDCELEDLIDDEQREWFVLDESARTAPVEEPEEDDEEEAKEEDLVRTPSKGERRAANES